MQYLNFRLPKQHRIMAITSLI